MSRSTARCYYRGQSANILSWTSAMDAFSFSLPAGEACPMIRADDPSYVCHGCYARVNRYGMPNVLTAQWIRFLWTKDCLKNPRGRHFWVQMMTAAVGEAASNGYFRGHDSGDFFHPEYVRMWYSVCKALPGVQFWFPTRCWPHSKAMGTAWQENLSALAKLPNVALRPSGLRYNDVPPKVPWLGPGTTVVTGIRKANHIHVRVCPKTINHGSCTDNKCRTCWDSKARVAYLVHGHLGRNIPPNAFSPKVMALRQKIQLTVMGK